jgi:hypothetical protein
MPWFTDTRRQRRYQLALRIVRQWRNLRALKCGGMGNDPDRRTAQTREGELAVECIACPKAGVNLPEGWEKAPLEMRYAYLPHLMKRPADLSKVSVHDFLSHRRMFSAQAEENLEQVARPQPSRWLGVFCPLLPLRGLRENVGGADRGKQHRASLRL